VLVLVVVLSSVLPASAEGVESGEEPEADTSEPSPEVGAVFAEGSVEEPEAEGSAAAASTEAQV
jgi:hypothetical protein